MRGGRRTWQTEVIGETGVRRWSEKELTRGGELKRVLAGVHAALHAGLEVKINAVVLGGINDRDAGALVQAADAAALGDAVLGLLADPARRAAMGEAGRQQVGEHAGALGRTLDLLDEVLQGRRA